MQRCKHGALDCVMLCIIRRASRRQTRGFHGGRPPHLPHSPRGGLSVALVQVPFDMMTRAMRHTHSRLPGPPEDSPTPWLPELGATAGWAARGTHQ
jgi:hypothetical protein